MSSPEMDELVEKFRTAVITRDYPVQAGMMIAILRRLAINGHPEQEWAREIAVQIVAIWETT